MKKSAKWIAAAVAAAALACVTVPLIVFASDEDTSAVHETEQCVPEALPQNAAVTVTLVRNGAAEEYTYFPVTCAEFLRFAGVSLTELDRVSVPADTVLTDHILIEISTTRSVERTETLTNPIEYDYIDVDTIPMGTVEVVTEGTPGVKNVTYLERYVDDALVSREVVSEEIVTQGIRGTAKRGIGGYVTSRDGTTYHYSYMKIMEATAYTYIPGLTTMTCATGHTLCKGCVAVDPRVIPMKTKMFITSDTIEYGYGSAEDTGGLIKGNIVDLAYMSYDECVQFGRRMMRVYILD